MPYPKSLKNGLTLIELIIVLAVIAIIGAILIPNFMDTTDKARLKSDIQSARVIGSALGLYNAEQSSSMNQSTMDAIITELSAKGYIDAEQAIIQTEGAKWELDTDGVTVVNISACDDNVRTKAFSQLSNQEKRYVSGQK